MRVSQNHPCEGGCGRTVSGTRLRCLRCLAQQVQDNLFQRDNQVRPLDEIKCELRGAIYEREGKIV